MKKQRKTRKVRKGRKARPARKVRKVQTNQRQEKPSETMVAAFEAAIEIRKGPGRWTLRVRGPNISPVHRTKGKAVAARRMFAEVLSAAVLKALRA